MISVDSNVANKPYVSSQIVYSCEKKCWYRASDDFYANTTALDEFHTPAI